MLLLSGITLSLNGQKNVVNKPEKFVKPVDGVELSPVNAKLSSIPWYVYSDRSDNPVFNTQTGQTASSKLGFGEKLAVVQLSQNGERLLVAHEPDIENRSLKSTSSSIGWVDIDNLLLWENCLIDPKYHIDKKAMILFTIDAARQQLNIPGERRSFTSNVPVMRKPSDVGFDTIQSHKGLFQFFPVFKRYGDFLLLGESFTLDKSKDFNGLKGWVHMKYVSEWSHRVAWEKNWERQAVNERESNTDSVGIMVLQTRNEAVRYASTDRKRNFTPFVDNEAPYLEMTFNTERKPGPMGRFPILDIEEINVPGQNVAGKPIKVGVIGEVMDLQGNEIPIQRLYDMTSEIRNLRKVNLLFVIDATESMEPYRKSVIDGARSALLEINKLYSDEEDKNDFLFGCLLYRDHHMELTTQKFGTSLSMDTAAFFRWLNTNLVPENNRRRPGVSGTDDLEEALFYGIQSALDDYGPDEKFSNYMIIIGDCGDHQDKSTPRNILYVDPKELVEELKSYNMNVLSLQVHHKNAPAFDLFQVQIKSLLEDIGKAQLTKNTKNKNLFELPDKADYVGKLLVCEKGKSINVAEMSKIISESIIQINEDVNGKIKNIAKAIKGQTDLDPWSTAKVIKFFSDNDFSAKQAESIIKSGMNQEYEVGYTVLKSAGYNHPYFQTVVLYSRKELEQVVKSFRDLSAAIDYPVSQQRTRLITAMNDWFKVYFSDIPANVLKDIPVGQLLEAITGLKFGGKYQDITISKVPHGAQISDLKIKEFSKDIQNSLIKLEEIYNTSRKYPAKVEIPGDTRTLYVYIPGDVFPSN